MAAIDTPVTLEQAVRAGQLNQLDTALIETFMLSQTSRPEMGLTFYDVFPWLDLPGVMGTEFRRALGLPTVTPRNLNETATRSVASTEVIKESLKIYQPEFIMDQVLLRTSAGAMEFANQTSMFGKAIMGLVMNHIFKGDEGSNSAQLTGLQARITGAQLVSEGSTDGGDPLQIATLRTAMDLCYGPNRVIFCGRSLSRRLDAAVSLSTVGPAIREDMTQWGAKAKTFDGVPIIPVCDLDGTDNVLQFNETGAGGSTATATSLYVVSLGLNGVHGLRNGGFFNQNVPSGTAGEFAMQGKMLFLPGLAIRRRQAAVRLYGISDAAVVA